MSKYRRPAHSIVEEPTFFLKHWWHGSLAWLKKHRDQVLTGALVVLVLLVALMVWKQRAQAKDIEAWERVGTPGSLPELEAATLRYSGTSAGEMLKIRLGDEYVNAGKPEKAERLYKEAAASKDSELAMRAQYSLGKAQEAAGRFEEALATLTALAGQEGFWAEKASEATEGQEKREAAYLRLKELTAAAEAAAAQAQEEAAQAESTEEPTTPPQEPQAEVGSIAAPGEEDSEVEDEQAIEPGGEAENN